MSLPDNDAVIDLRELDVDTVETLCRLEVGAWFETTGAIKAKSGSLQRRCRLNKLQEQLAELDAQALREGRPLRLIILKPRQKGCSTFSTAILYHRLSNRVQVGCIVGGAHTQGENLLRMVETYADNDDFAGENKARVSVGAGTANWPSGSRIEQQTARNPEVGRSGTYQVLVCTEVARWSEEGVANAAGILSGLLKCVPALPETLVILESTAMGASGDFYERYGAALTPEEWQAGGDGFVKVFAPWFVFPDSVREPGLEEITGPLDYTTDEREKAQDYDLSPQQVAWWRWALREECGGDPDKFQQDYPWDEETAFLSSGRLRFDAGRLKVMKERAMGTKVEHGCLDMQEDGHVSFRPAAVGDAWVWMWERPLDGCRYNLPVDPMTGITQTVGEDPDAHGAFVLRDGYYDSVGRWRPPMAVARVKYGAQWDIDILALEVAKLSMFYGRCVTVPEYNMDKGLIELLRVRGIPVYERQQWNRREKRPTNMLGWQTDSETRGMIIEMLARVIREQGVDGDGFDLFCVDAIRQLQNFVVKANGRAEAQSRKHDDDVLALAIGLATIKSATVYRSQRRKRTPPPDFRQWKRMR